MIEDGVAVQAALRWLSQQEASMRALLEELVNIDSGSADPQGVDAVGQRLARFFEDQALPVVWHSDEQGRVVLQAQAAAGRAAAPVLLMGHRDTVFHRGEAARRPFKVLGARAYGPGVADMKAGLVMNAYVLAAFHRHGGLARPLIGLFTADEEIGSPRSRAVIERVAPGAHAVFNAEPGRPNGNVVIGRKGGSFYRLVVRGRAAHAGGNFAEGISAVSELAHKVVALQAITDLERGVTLNVGVVRGGSTVNTVADHAEAQIDLRYASPQDKAQALARIRAITASATVPGTEASLERLGEFDPFESSEGSQRLFELYRDALAGFGQLVEGEFSGGCADSGITSQLGCPTVCAVGPVGGKFHTEDEYLELASLLPRTQGLALAVARLQT